MCLCFAAVASSVWQCSVLRRYWCAWHRALQDRQTDRVKGQIAENLALHATQRRAFSRWKECILRFIVIIFTNEFIIHYL